MRKWFKYILNDENNQKFFPRDKTFNEHKKSMGGYKTDRGYSSKEDFFQTFFYSGHSRFKYYHNYLKQHLRREEDILSIGSGRCINELLLNEDGFNIICSDLDQPCREETAKIFPNLRFVKYDVRTSHFKHNFDCIISLGVFHLFDEKELLTAFKNISGSLRSGGRLIFDPGGAEENLFTYILDEIVCKYETGLRQLLEKLVKHNRYVTAKKHHGYRSRDKEIILVAKEAGFTFHSLRCHDYGTEIERTILLSKLPKKAINRVGKLAPYIRIFTFLKK